MNDRKYFVLISNMLTHLLVALPHFPPIFHITVIPLPATNVTMTMITSPAPGEGPQ